jgi:hypothetical protein
VLVKSQVFWDVTLCPLVNSYGRFELSWRIHFPEDRASQEEYLGLFGAEDESANILRKSITIY